MFENFGQHWGYWWDLLQNYYKINPYIFLITYVVKNIVFWWLVAVIVMRIRKRDWNSVTVLIPLNAAIDVLPWVYVWIWGENEPWWYPYMVIFIGAWGFVCLLWHIWQKLHEYGKHDKEQEEQAKPDLNESALEELDQK